MGFYSSVKISVSYCPKLARPVLIFSNFVLTVESDILGIVILEIAILGIVI